MNNIHWQLATNYFKRLTLSQKHLTDSQKHVILPSKHPKGPTTRHPLTQKPLRKTKQRPIMIQKHSQTNHNNSLKSEKSHKNPQPPTTII